MAVYFGCVLPEELYFDVERDVWIRFEDDGTATIGMTDIAQTRCGKLLYMKFKPPGKVIAQGMFAATIESSKWVGPFPMPFTGEIIANNEAGYEKDILLLNKKPYTDGWLVKVRPTNLEEERGHLLTGEAAVEAYKARIEELEVNCLRCLDDGTLFELDELG